MTSREVMVTAIGGLAVLLALGGWAITEANTGPLEHELAAVEHATQLEGTYVVRDGSASSPVCRSPGTEETCDPETELDVSVIGLPELGEQAAYAAFLTDGEQTELLDRLEASGEAHRLAFAGEIDADTYGTLMLALVDGDDPATPAFQLHAWELPTSGGETVDLATSSPVQLAPAEGQLSLAQIGAVEIAVTAEAHLDGLPEADGWRYVAWLVDDDADTWTSLGELATAGEGSYTLDARVERVTLAEQDRFLVTLEAPGAGTSRANPAGFPVVETAVRAEALIR